jgi:hypothetical protein
MQSSAVAQRNVQSTSAASASAAAVEALEGFWATEPLTSGGLTSEQLNRGHDGNGEMASRSGGVLGAVVCCGVLYCAVLCGAVLSLYLRVAVRQPTPQVRWQGEFRRRGAAAESPKRTR